MACMLSIENIESGYGPMQVLWQPSLEVQKGSITSLLGPNGVGKTTLLKLIGGQIRPSSGSIKVDGENISVLGTRALYELRKRMGMMFQSGALLTDLSVYENVAFPLREHTKLPESMIRKLVLMKLEAVGLRGVRELMPSELSGGMARRVALARAIALDPDNPRMRDSYANFLANQGRPEEAIKEWQAVIRVAPDHYAAHVNMGAVLGDVGRWAEAIEMYNEAIGRSSDSSSAWTELPELERSASSP